MPLPEVDGHPVPEHAELASRMLLVMARAPLLRMPGPVPPVLLAKVLFASVSVAPLLLEIPPLVLAVLEEKLDWFERVLKAPMLAYASALALMFFCIEVFGVIDASIPFVYFQF